MKKLFRCTILILALILFVVPAAALATSADQTLVILHTNDFHGHPLKFNYQGIPDVGGLPAVATLVQQVRNQHKNVLVLDAGDVNTGRAESNLFKAVPDILGLNYLGYDAMTLGNHEFDNPLHILRKQEKLARFPFLSANITTIERVPLVRPYVMKRFDGFKVGILGLTLKETKWIGYPDHVKDLVFEDEVKAARGLVKGLKNKADIVIALVHLGIWNNENMASISGGAGGFPQVSEGVRFTINTAARKSEGVFIKGKPIDPEKTYSIATNSYLAGGGDGYKILLEALDRYDTSTFQRDVLVEYIATVRKTLKPELEGRIRVVQSIMSFKEVSEIVTLASAFAGVNSGGSPEAY